MKKIRIFCAVFSMLCLRIIFVFVLIPDISTCFLMTPLKIWLQELGKYLGHLHLHDNHGKTDEHLPVGCGTFPFAELFQTLRAIGAKPTMTLEAHNQDALWESLNNIKSMKLLDFLN